MSAIIDADKCTGCGICEGICPGDIIYMSEDGAKAEVRYPDECWICGSCRMECPENAIIYAFS